MKLDLAKSKMLPVSKLMPPLAHWVEVLPDGRRDRSKSEVLKWIAQQEELQVWILSILRQGGLVVYDPNTRTYRGNPDWVMEKHEKRRQDERSGKCQRAANRGGRKREHNGNVLLYELSKGPMYVGDMVKLCQSYGPMARSTAFRIIRELKDSGKIEWTKDGYSLKTNETPETAIPPAVSAGTA